MNNGPIESETAQVLVSCRFVRGRNALLASADFEPIFVDCYLHLGQSGVVLAGGADEKLKQLVALLALCGATQPRTETLAWTVHFESEEMNLFGVAENPSGRVVGRVFSQNVRLRGTNVLHAETASANGSRRRSSIDFSGDSILRMAEHFYAQSEQRPARFFELDGDHFAVLMAQPDCDLDWLSSVSSSDVCALIGDPSQPVLETRRYSFSCGCNAARIASAIGPAISGELDALFGADEYINVECPRCGVRHEIARDAFG
jgi:molecular chaperone Hsp33